MGSAETLRETTAAATTREGAAIPRQRFTTLVDADRLLTERDRSGTPYVTTEAGGLYFARYQGVTSQMASRLRDAGIGTARIVGILRQQWPRPGRQATGVLLKDFAGIAPGWDEWLVEQGAIARRTRFVQYAGTDRLRTVARPVGGERSATGAVPRA
jgi:hypothetical protein